MTAKPVRRLTGVERKQARALAGSLLFGGEHKRAVRSEVTGYLVARGWDMVPAKLRACEIVDAAAVDDAEMKRL